MDHPFSFISKRQNLFKISQQTIWQLLAKAVSSFSTIIILSAVARNLGAEEVGSLTLALAFLTFFYLVSDFGLNAHVLPLFLKDGLTAQWQKLFGMRLVLSFVSIFLAIIILLLWPSSSPVFKQTVFWGLISVFFSGIFITSTALFQSKLLYDRVLIANSTGSLITLVLVLFFAWQKIGTPYLILGYVFGSLATGFLSLLLARKYLKNLWPVIDSKYMFSIFKNSWPISATLVLNMVYFRVDTFILSFYQPLSQVGIYNLAYQIFQSLLVIPAFIMNSFYPLMLSQFSHTREKFFNNLTRASMGMLAIALLGTVLTLLLAPFVISIVGGGKAFSGSVTSLQILSLGFPAFFVSSVLMWALIILKKYKTMLAIYFGGMMVNTLLNLIFIPRYSYIAASWITLVCEYLILGAQLVILTKYKLSLGQSLKPEEVLV
ncbi:MAG: flippase [Patescibacteria group bacterium]|nr:flippase [Patescibacteria group bacterium]